MKKILFYILFVTSTMFFFSCEKTLSTVKDLNLQHEPMLAITFSNDSAGYLKGTISQTKNVTGTNNQIDFLENAKAYIYEEGVLKDSLTFDNIIKQYHSTLNSFLAGKIYKLVVQHPSFKNAEASDIMPTQVIPQSDFKPESKTFYIPEYEQNMLFDEISITLNDDAGTTDYYSIVIYGRDSFSNLLYPLETLCFDNDLETEYDDDDPTTTESLTYGKLIFKDKNFDGVNKKIIIYSRHDLWAVTEVICVVSHMSENYYRYLKTFGRYQNTEGNPFAEPVQVYSNTINGAGIFALRRDYSIKLK